MIFKTLSILVITGSLFACSSKPNHLIISPAINDKAPSLYQQTTSTIRVADLRTSPSIVQIHREGEASELYSSKQQLSQRVAEHLTAQFAVQGLTIDTNAATHIEVIINKAKVSVEQYLMQYDSASEINILVRISKGEKTLSKTFKATASTNKPLSADISVLQQNFNQQLGKVLFQIVNSDEIVQFIR